MVSSQNNCAAGEMIQLPKYRSSVPSEVPYSIQNMIMELAGITQDLTRNPGLLDNQ